MKLTIIILGTYAFFLYKGFRKPLFFALAFIWFSFLYPQAFCSPSLFVLPFTMISGVLALLGYFLVERRGFPRITPVFVWIAIFAGWVTLTTVWALFPEEAWFKWDWAFKSILVALLMPIFFRTRAEIESALIVIFFGIGAHIGVGGVKTSLGGGGYGSLATLMRSNTWLGESSMLSTAAIISIPMAYYILTSSLSAAYIPWRRLMLIGWSAVSIVCMIGTAARAGLVALGAFLMIGISGLGNKIKFTAAALLISAVVYPYLPDAWLDRMGTIKGYETDSSAMGRLRVWTWTANFAATHPLGGGFDAYLANQITRQSDGTRKAKAFHSIYFELLGEQGYIGLSIYLLFALSTLVGLWRFTKGRGLRDDQLWMIPFSKCMFAGLVTLLVGGAFIGIAYQPTCFATFGFYLCLHQAKNAPPDHFHMLEPEPDLIGTEENSEVAGYQSVA